MAVPRASRCIAWAVIVGLTVAGCATTKSAGEDATVGETAAVTQSRSTPMAGQSSGGATVVAEEQNATPPVGESTGTDATTEQYSPPPTEDPTTRHDGGSPGQLESLNLGGPRLGGNFTGPGHWVPDGDPPRSISVAADLNVTTDGGASFNGPGWLGPPEVPDVEVVGVSVTPDQLFAPVGNCTRLTTEPSDCMLSLTFDYGHSITGHRYSADLSFHLRATCPASVGQGCTDENGASIPPGQEVTWTSSIRLTTTGCDPGCLKSGEGGVAESPDQAPADQPASPADQPASPADQPASPADQPPVAGPVSVSGGG